jgi:outer membrane murein-binding lipoprotein Lpp
MCRHRAVRATVALLVAATLGVLLAGCGVISKVKDVAGNVQTLTEMADKLKDSSDLTYTAEYRTSDAKTVRLVQAPPRSAYLGPDGAYIASPDSTLLCQDGSGRPTCQKAPPRGDVAITDAAMLSTVTGQGFVPPSLAIGLLAAAALYPEAKVEQTDDKIAGQSATCAKVTGLSTATPDSTGDSKPPPVEDFTICITEDGILGSFEGTLQDGAKGRVTLMKYSATADPSAFNPPAGATIIEVGQLSPR